MCGKFDTGQGVFIVETSDLVWDGAKVGMNMKVRFLPHRSAHAGSVALVQVISCRKGASLAQLNANYFDNGDAEAALIESAAHWHVDAKGDPARMKTKAPAFGLDFSSDATSPADKWLSVKANSDSARKKLHVTHKAFLGATQPRLEAMLFDAPRRAPTAAVMAFEHRFEIVAVLVNPATASANGIRLGALTWGYAYTRNAQTGIAAIVRQPPEAFANASQEWIDACKKWGAVGGGRLAVPGLAFAPRAANAMPIGGVQLMRIDTKMDSKADNKHAGQYDNKSPSASTTAATGSAAAGSGPAAAGSAGASVLYAAPTMTPAAAATTAAAGARQWTAEEIAALLKASPLSEFDSMG